MSAGSTAAPSYRWLLGMSAWMLLTAVPQGAFAWIGFLVIAIIAKRLSWGVIGVIAGAAVLLARLPIWGEYQPIAVLLVYLAGMLLALWLNPAWLRTMWERRQTRQTMLARSEPKSRAARETPNRAHHTKNSSGRRGTPPAAGRARGQAAADASSATAVAAPSGPDLSAEAAAQRLAQRVGATTEGMLADPPSQETLEPIDVNEATAAQLAKLPGFTRNLAQSAVRTRRKDGRFTSVEEFASRMKLQPHQLVRLRDHAVCAPPPRGPRSFGRRVDY